MRRPPEGGLFLEGSGLRKDLCSVGMYEGVKLRSETDGAIALAELERNLVIERVRSGMRCAKINGRISSFRPFQKVWVEKQHLRLP